MFENNDNSTIIIIIIIKNLIRIFNDAIVLAAVKFKEKPIEFPLLIILYQSAPKIINSKLRSSLESE